MKQKLLKSLSFFLVLVIYLASFATASASGRGILSSDYLTCYSAYTYSEGSGDISVWFDVTGTDIMDEIGALTIILQESSNNSSWSTVKTFRYTNYPNMMEYNSADCVSGVYYSGVDGRYYRAYVTVWAGKDGGGDSRQILTSSVQA